MTAMTSRALGIDLAELAGTVSTADQYSKALTSRLAGVLEEVSKTFHYDYTLELSPDKSMLAGDGSAQTVRVDPAIGRVHLPVEFTFTWSPPARPVFGAVRMLQIFITAPPPEVSVLTLTEIYLAFAGGLALLLTIPPALNAIDTRKQLATVKNSVMTVQAGSSYIGGECPNERGRLGSGFLIRPADVVVVCPGCGTAHHLSCWHSTQDTCWVRTCRRQMTIPPAMLRTHGLEEV